MESVSRWVDQAVQQVGLLLGPFMPKVLGALAIVAAAWLGARLARTAATRAAARIRLDERLQSPGITATLAGVASALVWLLALPALLGTLELQGLLTPVNAMLSRLLAFVPNLIGSVVVLGIGLLLAGIARQVVSGLARAAGSERAAEKLGLAASLGADGLAGLVGRIVFALLLLPTLMAALQPLGMDALTQPLSRLFETIVNMVPRLISAALVIGIAVLLGRALANLASAMLAGAGLDRLPSRMGMAGASTASGAGAGAGGPASPSWQLAGRTPSEWVGTAIMMGLVLVAIAQATEILGLPVLTEIVATAGAALARLAVAVVTLVAGVLLATLAARGIEAGSLPNARVVAWGARGAILFFAGALALRMAGLPAEIVAIAFGAVVGAVAIAVAVAFGIGGREVAARAVEHVAASFERVAQPEAASDAVRSAPAAQPPHGTSTNPTAAPHQRPGT